jgi:aldose 1-epimerase
MPNRMSFEIADTTWDGYPTKTLRSADGSLAATFATQIGMVGCSLEHRGAELLAQRRGLAAYEATGSTMGIPLLHPWANRLSGLRYAAAGREVELDRDSPLLRLDPNGLPIHGVLAASPHWQVTARDSDGNAARLSAELDFGAHPELLEAFPFPHRIELSATLSANALRIDTTIEPTAEVAVPISFGFHPYLRLPGLPRDDWEVELPVRRRLVTDERGIPTGATEPAPNVEAGPLAGRTYDDGYCDLADPPVFVLQGGGRRIELEFLRGYDFAQVYAPPGEELICFEPMTAATNALVAGGLRLAEPGTRFEAAFEIRV